MPLKSYRDLVVWQQSMDLAADLYTLTALFPSNERYGLTSQLRRAGVSIPANISEGYGRRTRGEYVNQLSVAGGSVCEIETLLVLSRRFGYISEEQAAEFAERLRVVGAMLWRLGDRLGARQKPTRKLRRTTPGNP